MGERKRLILLILIMAVVSGSGIGTAIIILRNTALQVAREGLVETAQSQARLIEAVARHNRSYDKGDYPGGAEAGTLSQIMEAHKNYRGFGETGEFTLARREGDQVVFLLRHRHADLDEPKPVPFDSGLAEPMRRALSGLSGTVVGLDYRGVTVLAAYEPVAELDWGIVAKIDLAEVHAPLVRASIIAFSIGGSAILAGALLFLGLINPLIRRLKESEERYRKLVEIAPLLIAIHDEESLVYLNEAGMKLMRADCPGQVIGKPVIDFVAPESRQRVVERIQRALKNKEPALLHDETFLRVDGTSVDVRVVGTPFTHNDRTLMLVIAEDISERKQIEEKLQKIGEIKSLGTLAGGIAHDFNNILTSIMTNLSMARTFGSLPDDISSMLTDAEKASLQARNLTRKLLAFAKGGEPIKKPISISGILEDTVQFALSGSKSICEYYIPDDLWVVDADEAQIGQAVQNLIINADQAMSEGGTIKTFLENVTIEEKDALPLRSGRYVKLSIKDQGTGIAKKHLPKIFDPFFTTKQKGNGLGLSTTFTIVYNHGGYVDLESKLGVGTSFFLYLPASKRRSSTVEKKSGGPIKGKGRILLIDDDEMIRKATGTMIERLGYGIEAAQDGREGIELYEKAMKIGTAFDVVIMDLTIPGGMGGVETIKELKKIDSDVEVIVSSGYSEDPVMSKFKSYGFSGVAAKPYSIDELAEEIHRVLSRQRR